MEDWLKKWYNDQFTKIDLSPSSKVWDNISVSMEKWPSHWYRSNIYDLKTEPRPSTWQSVNSQLADIYYPSRSRRPSYVLIAIAVLLLSLIPISLSDGSILISEEDHYLARYETSNSINRDNTISNKVTDKPLKSSDNQNTDLTVDKNSGGKIRLENTASVKNTTSKESTSTWIPISKPEFKDEIKGKLSIIDSIKTNSPNILSLEQRVINYPKTNLHKDIVLLSKDVFEPKYSIGLHIVPQFSSLLNPLRTKIRANNDVEKLNPLSIGFDLSFEKYISSKNSLHVSVRGNNVKSLKFRENNISKEIRLNYASLNLSYGRKWQLGSSDKLFLRTYIGVFAGYTVSKDVNYDGERVDYIEDGLKSMDFGNSINLVLSRKLSDRTRLEIGTNSQLGVMNIFKGTDVLPSKYFRTSTISYGLNIGVIREF